jgi:molybdate-binding protein/DNA-binding XRE family transcriptional regulator
VLIRTHLQEIRTGRGLSAADLARRIGVSRQTIYAIEDGSFVPNTAVALQLSRVLDVNVEEIFSIAEERAAEPVSADLLPGNFAAKGQLAQVCRVNERVVAVPTSFLPAYLPPADGVVESRTRSGVSIKLAVGLPGAGERLLIAGCDPALSLLHNALAASKIEIITVPSSSHRALQWLKQGRIHAAGSHLRDGTSGDYNVPIIRRLLPESSVRVVTFATWEQGLVVAHGNPKGIRSIADLASRNVTFINREKGSGSRDWLDKGLYEFGIPPKRIRGYDSIAQGHFAAAYTVASGSADSCIAPRSACLTFGLTFIPLAVERFDLSFSRASLELPAARAVLDLLSRSTLRKKLQCIAGYDTTHTGDVLI